MGGDADTDLALAINGGGNYYIPGTSLAGALRGWMSKPFSADDSQGSTNNLKSPDHPINQLWGFQEKDKGHASFIIVDDAEIKLRKGQSIEIREGVGIDRHTGAAAERFKYSRAILPKGVSFPLHITLDCQKNEDPTNVWQLLQALEMGDIRIGAAKTRGLGRVKLEQIVVHQQNLSNADGLFDTLLNDGTGRPWKELKPKNYQSPAQLTFELAWSPRDPVMVKAEGDGIAIDMLPLVSQVDSGVRFVIPGSSIKGVLRAHAERILRTVLDIDITPDKDNTPKFNDQLQLVKGKKRIPLTDVIFGAAEKSKTKNSEGQMGVLSIDDCYAKLSMTLENWSAVENAKKEDTEEFKGFKQALKKALGGNQEPFHTLQPAMHVAIDRWTGGAADGMLYSVLEPIGVDWDAIGIRLDIAQLKKIEAIKKKEDSQSPSVLKPAIALLLLVLRDFANRKIPIGYGTNRGMGTVEVTAMTLDGAQLDDLEGLSGEQSITPDLSSLGEPLLDELTEAWQDWIAYLTELEAA
ncbi:MAG: RAMP superfamily CRISPR-associated protein [Leptolyngbyaceae cyanobacterium]